jgi:RHH-type proline utilization regulon transcriptional repressor/proline dehydrogenase/delta 1-pyrroline-5-carboxylate dehydrogenase
MFYPFLDFSGHILLLQSVIRTAITAAYRRLESEAFAMLLDRRCLPTLDTAKVTHNTAYVIAETLRNPKSANSRDVLAQCLLQEFSISSQ